MKDQRAIGGDVSVVMEKKLIVPAELDVGRRAVQQAEERSVLIHRQNKAVSQAVFCMSRGLDCRYRLSNIREMLCRSQSGSCQLLRKPFTLWHWHTGITL